MPPDAVTYRNNHAGLSYNTGSKGLAEEVPCAPDRVYQLVVGA